MKEDRISLYLLMKTVMIGACI